MVMQLNLTLLVQMLHFLFAYFLISKFLLKPGYDVIKADENRLHQVRSLLVTEQEVVAQKQEYKRQRWQMCQNYFYQHRPIFEQDIQGITSFKSVEKPTEIEQKNLEKVGDEISGKLKETMLNG